MKKKKIPDHFLTEDLFIFVQIFSERKKDLPTNREIFADSKIGDA